MSTERSQRPLVLQFQKVLGTITFRVGKSINPNRFPRQVLVLRNQNLFIFWMGGKIIRFPEHLQADPFEPEDFTVLFPCLLAVTGNHG